MSVLWQADSYSKEEGYRCSVMSETVFLEIWGRREGIEYLVPIEPIIKFNVNGVTRAWRHIIENNIEYYVVYGARTLIDNRDNAGVE